MSKRIQLIVIFLVVMAVSSVTSHLVAWKSGIISTTGIKLHFGKETKEQVAFAAGSSLTFYGIAWMDVANAINSEIVSHAVSGGSVVEMEVFYRRYSKASPTFIGISAFDLNENYISNYRAQVVPFCEEVRDLWEVRADWAHSKRVLSLYPVECIRMIFPTVGHSTELMVRLREILQAIFHNRPQAQKPSSEGATITDKGNTQTSSIAEWTPDHLRRSIADSRETFDFSGTKRQSLLRFIQQGKAQGKVVIIVMPESPVFVSEFLTKEVRHRFENLLTDAQKAVPEGIWIRLDLEPRLNSTRYYWDLIHLNAYGQAIATEILLRRLEAAGLGK